MLSQSAAPAIAATYFVRGNARGSTSGSCGSFGTPCRYIGLVNARVLPGDNVDCDSLNVTVAADSGGVNTIAPATNGTASARIRYFTPATSPPTTGLRVINNVIVERSFITISGFRIRNWVDLDYKDESKKANNDSLVNNLIMDDVAFRGPQDCMVAGNIIKGKVDFLTDKGFPTCSEYTDTDPAHPGDPAYGIALFKSAAARDTLRRNIINLGTLSHQPSRSGMLVGGVTQYCLIDSNQVSAHFGPAAGSGAYGNDEAWGLILYGVTACTWRDNHWRLTSSASTSQGKEHEFLRVRNTSRFNTWVRDTFDFGWDETSAANGPWTGHLSTSSIDTFKVDYCWPRGVQGNEIPYNNTFDRCVFRTRGDSPYAFSLKAQQGWKGYMMRDCVIEALASGGLGITNADGGSIINNTISAKRAALSFDQYPGAGGPPPKNMIIKGNIFYTDSTTVGAPYVVRTDASPVNSANPGGNQIDRNLYLARTGAVSGGGQGALRRYAVGYAGSRSPVDPDSSWCFDLGYDCNSRWGDPLFAYSVPMDTLFNPQIGIGSPAYDPDFWPPHPLAVVNFEDSSFVGAKAPLHDIPPGTPWGFTAVAHNGVTYIQKVVRWSVSGDDSMSGKADSVFIAEAPPNTDITPENFMTYMIAGTHARMPGENQIWSCRLGVDFYDQEHCGTDAITDPNIIGNYRIAVRDHAGNFGYSKTVEMTIQ